MSEPRLTGFKDFPDVRGGMHSHTVSPTDHYGNRNIGSHVGAGLKPAPTQSHHSCVLRNVGLCEMNLKNPANPLIGKIGVQTISTKGGSQ